MRKCNCPEVKLQQGHLENCPTQWLDEDISKPPWWSRLLCMLGNHDWRDGPGFPCVSCGKSDDIWRKL